TRLASIHARPAEGRPARAGNVVVKIAGAPPTFPALGAQCPSPPLAPGKCATSEGRGVRWHVAAPPKPAIPRMVVPRDARGRSGGASPYESTVPSSLASQ